LVISRPQVDFWEHCGSPQLIQQVINPRHWVLILYGQLIQLTVVNTQPWTVVLLLYQEYRFCPRWCTRSDKLLLKQVFYLFLQLSQLCWRHPIRCHVLQPKSWWDDEPKIKFVKYRVWSHHHNYYRKLWKTIKYKTRFAKNKIWGLEAGYAWGRY